MEVPGCLVDFLLAAVAVRLPNLTWLRVVGSHESGAISKSYMEQLGVEQLVCTVCIYIYAHFLYVCTVCEQNIYSRLS